MTTQTQDKPEEKKPTIADYLKSDLFRSQIANALPEKMSPKRFAQLALTAVIRNRDLARCTRESIYKCLMDLSSMGLEPDGRRAHLIPFKENLPNGKFNLICTLVVDYKGIAECVRRNGDVATIHCDIVGDNDFFVCRYGSGGKLEHAPKIKDRGKIWCVYSFVRLKSGDEEWDVMSVEEVEMVRQRSRSRDSLPWKEHWNEMAKKTVFRRHSKTLPLSPETRMVVEHGEDEEFGFIKAVPAIIPSPQAGLPPGDDFIDLGGVTDGEPAAEEVKAPPRAQSAPVASSAPKPAPKAQKPPEQKTTPVKKPDRAPQKPDHELFGQEPEADNDADRLILALHRDGIKWDDFCNWIASTGALGTHYTEIIPVSDLKPELLADCVQNYQANIEEFARWKESLHPQDS